MANKLPRYSHKYLGWRKLETIEKGLQSALDVHYEYMNQLSSEEEWGFRTAIENQLHEIRSEKNIYHNMKTRPSGFVDWVIIQLFEWSTRDRFRSDIYVVD